MPCLQPLLAFGHCENECLISEPSIEIINRRHIKNDPARQDLMREISLNAKVAKPINTIEMFGRSRH